MVPSGGLVAEVGVGTGSLLPSLAAKGDQVLGFDHSPAMIKLARTMVEEKQLGAKVDVRLAEMSHLPCADGSVHALVMNQVLHHAEQPVEVLKEIARVLEPGGSLVVADLTRHGHDWARERLADQWLGFNQEELEKWLNDAGLSMIARQEVGVHSDQQSVLLLKAAFYKT